MNCSGALANFAGPCQKCRNYGPDRHVVRVEHVGQYGELVSEATVYCGVCCPVCNGTRDEPANERPVCAGPAPARPSRRGMTGPAVEQGDSPELIERPINQASGVRG